jgi:hypothetical protein
MDPFRTAQILPIASRGTLGSLFLGCVELADATAVD